GHHAEGVAAVSAGVGGVAEPFEEGRGVAARREAVAEDADLAVGVEVVERDELLGQGVVVRRHVAPEERERRVAVAATEVAEHLIVGAVLLDYVEDVADRQLEPAPRVEDGRARLDLPRPLAAPRLDLGGLDDREAAL